MARITSVESLRTLYRAPSGRALGKQLDHLDRHCRRFIELSPFLALSTTGVDGRADVSPRGDHPGFVGVLDERTLVIPDRPGNNRLDTLTNLIAQPAVGLLFLVPGVDEVLRVHGEGEVRDDPELREPLAVDGKVPKLAILVRVQEAYLHCAKALMRARLWDPAGRVDRGALPSMGEMMRDQMGSTAQAETQEEMQRRYRETLY
jgi:uncharacterized protein